MKKKLCLGKTDLKGNKKINYGKIYSYLRAGALHKHTVFTILLASAMLSAPMISANAAAFYDVGDDEYGRAAGDLAMYGIVAGKGDGMFCPDDYVKRSEFAKMAVIASDTELKQSASSLFSDVDRYHWANGYIDAAARNKLITGYPGGVFCPDNNLTYAEAVTVVLRMLGYGTAEIGNNYPMAYLDKAYELGITEGLYFDYNEPIDRKNTALIISRALMTDKKGSGKKLIEQLDFKVSEECMILPGYLTAADEVSTSDGIYKSLVDTDIYEGKRVKLVLDKDNKVAAVVPVSGNTELITVQSIIGSDISYTSGNSYGVIRPDSTTKTYYQNSEYSFSAVKSEIKPGMKMLLCTNNVGRTDCIMLYENELSGPYIAGERLSDLGIGTEGRSFMKNGAFCGAEAVGKNDVLYFDDEYVYVYDNKVTGVYEKASPYKSDVKSITLSGKEYEIETQSAADKLGNGSGAFAINDYITLLLGRDGKIAGVQAAADAGERYPIVAVLENDIVYIKDGKIGSIKAENNWRINYGGSETTFGAIKSNDFENALLTVFCKADGSFDYGVIDEYDLKGPRTVPAGGNTDGMFGIDESAKADMRVIRDGSDADISDIKANDVLYYSDIQNTLYAYCDSELGVFEDAYPNKANAKSIKLSGVVYEIETREVLDKLKGFEKNDYMTLLLGKDGKVADIKSTGSSVSDKAGTEKSGTQLGILLSCRTGMDEGTRSYYATMLTDNGRTAEYKTDRGYEDYIGRAAELIFEDGRLVPKFLRNSDLSGEIDKSNRRIGGKYLADDCVFIDVSFIPDNDQANDGYPAAAEEIEFSEITVSKISKGQIISEEYDENGDICFIAFDNITNSRYKYGMVTDYERSESSSWFEIDLGGTVKRYTSALNTDIGRVPVMANIQKGKLLNLYALDEVKTSGKFVSVDKQRIKIGNTSYRLHKNFVIYTKDKNKKYSPIDIDDLDTANISSVRIYADKAIENGGVVRIVVIESV